MQSRVTDLRPRERTRQLVRDIQRALRRESWGRNILQLAWTAGPVTYLALQGGYLLGYGKSAPQALFIYFGVYTVIAGTVAILVRVIHQATTGREIERGTRVLRDCLDQLPRLLLAAKHLLANPDAGESAVEAAIRDLGGSRDLAYAFQRIEVFRRNGMPSRVAAERKTSAHEIDQLIAGLWARSPDTATLVEERSFGRAPSKRRGRVRTEGFIERALTAETEDNARLMSLSDVEEILTLVIELLVGGTIALISFDFAGDRRIAEGWSALERARRDFRARLRARNSRLRIVAERLAGRMEGVVSSVARIGNATELRDEGVRALDRWAREFAPPRLRRRDRRGEDGFRRALAAYRSLEQASRALHRAHGELLAAYRQYQDIVGVRSQREQSPVRFAADAGDGVKITESELGLNERQRIALARDVRRILEQAGCWRVDTMSADAGVMLGLAAELLAATENYLPLYRTEVQQAIELTRAPTIESLEPGLSADVRAGWVVALVDEVEPDVTEYAVRRIDQLIRFHALKLGVRSRERIAARFGIDEGVLESISAQPVEGGLPWVSPPMKIPERYDRLKGVVDATGRWWGSSRLPQSRSPCQHDGPPCQDQNPESQAICP